MTERRPRALHVGAAADGFVDLDPEESHHLLRVLRLRPGQPLSIFDGRGREWDAILESVERGTARARLGAELRDRVEPELTVTLLQGLCRPERVEWVLQKGTEVGVSVFRLVAAERSEGPEPSPGRLDRWSRIVVEACKQSGRRRVPVLEAPVPLSFEPVETASAFVADPAPGATPLGLLVRGAAPREARIAVGPEGGFTPEEIHRLTDAGWRRASLGPRVLRTETAGLVACAIVLHAWGDLGAGPTAR